MSTYTHYDMLDLDCDATQEEIRHAYKVLAMKWHPDRNKAKYAAERFMKIKEAYDVLSDKRRRAEYDEMLNDDTAEASGSVLDDEEAVTEIIVVSKQLLRNGKADAIVLRYMGEEGLKTSEALWLLGKIKASLEKKNSEKKRKLSITSGRLGVSPRHQKSNLGFLCRWLLWNFAGNLHCGRLFDWCGARSDCQCGSHGCWDNRLSHHQAVAYVVMGFLACLSCL